MLIRKEFEQIQKTTGFSLELLEKAYHITRVLNEMQKQPILRENLILKGGTALNFIYLNIPRLSIDLDFDYTGKITKEEMVEQRLQIEKEIKEIFSKLDYNIRDRGSSYIISRQSLQYQTIRNTRDHIKIEVNYLDRMPLGKIEKKEFLTSSLKSAFSAAVMGGSVCFFMKHFDFQRLIFLEQLGVLLSSIVIGILIYLLMNLVFNHEDLRSLRDIFSSERVLKE